MIYLDSTAVVKLVHAEPESPALRSWLDERAETGWISSVLTEIESFRALARYAPDAVSRLPAVLDQIDLIDLGPTIRILAQTAKPLTVRSLDAIHLGTALHSRSGLTSFVTYDKRLLEAARAAGLPVDSPAQQQPATPQPSQPAPGTDENPPLSSGWYRHAVMNPADAPNFFARVDSEVHFRQRFDKLYEQVAL
jgi:predicted nucleic acid-binding protein